MFLLFCSFFVVASCSRHSENIYKEQIFAFGTIVEVNIWGVHPDKAKNALVVLKNDFEYMHRTWHPWKGGSLARMNGLFPHGEFFSASPAVLPLITLSSELSDKSAYLFNPAIGNIIKLWNFDDPENRALPDNKKIMDLVKKNMTMKNITIDGIRVRSEDKDLALDFGAIAKGYGVDKTIETLKQLGISNAIVNAGGDLRGIGQPGDRKWKVGIRHPRQQGVMASLEINGDESIFTSGDYERFFELEGKRYHHIIDPRTGYPAQGVMSVTVIHGTAAIADAAATALFIAGPKAWYTTAQKLGLKWVMLVDTDRRVYLTPAMAERITFEPGEQYTVVVSEPL